MAFFKNKKQNTPTTFLFSLWVRLTFKHVDSSVTQPMDSYLEFSFRKAGECYQVPLNCDFKRKFRKIRHSVNETLKNLGQWFSTLSLETPGTFFKKLFYFFPGSFLKYLSPAPYPEFGIQLEGKAPAPAFVSFSKGCVWGVLQGCWLMH